MLWLSYAKVLQLKAVSGLSLLVSEARSLLGGQHEAAWLALTVADEKRIVPSLVEDGVSLFAGDQAVVVAHGFCAVHKRNRRQPKLAHRFLSFTKRGVVPSAVLSN